MDTSRRSTQSRGLFIAFLACFFLNGCGGNDPRNEALAAGTFDTVAVETGDNSAGSDTAGSNAEPSELGACNGLPDKAAIEKVMGVSVSDPVELPVGCELRGTANTSDVVTFTRQTVREKDALLKYRADTGGDPPTPLGDPALPNAVVAVSYSVLYDKGDTNYMTQVVVGDGSAGSGLPRATELMKLWVGP